MNGFNETNQNPLRDFITPTKLDSHDTGDLFPTPVAPTPTSFNMPWSNQFFISPPTYPLNFETPLKVVGDVAVAAASAGVAATLDLHHNRFLNIQGNEISQQHQLEPHYKQQLLQQQNEQKAARQLEREKTQQQHHQHGNNHNQQLQQEAILLGSAGIRTPASLVKYYNETQRKSAVNKHLDGDIQDYNTDTFEELDKLGPQQLTRMIVEAEQRWEYLNNALSIEMQRAVSLGLDPSKY